MQNISRFYLWIGVTVLLTLETAPHAMLRIHTVTERAAARTATVYWVFVKL